MRKFLLAFVALLISISVSAQNRVVTGKVTDEKSAPVVNASVTVPGTKLGTTTDNLGNFSISVPAATKALVISSVNMNPFRLSLSASKSEYEVSLTSSTQALDEVVIVGYGSGKRKEAVAGSLSKVDGKNVENRPAANLLDALQGRVAGLQVYTSTGEPSATQSVRLHGVGSLSGGNTPLYILDGMQVSSGTIVSLNPNDIESVTVLKDASTTSIYGAQAANGVIYYTTKKGRANRSTFSVEAQYGVSNLTNNTVDMFNSFMNTKQLTDFWLAVGYRTQAQVNALLAAYPFDTKWYKTYYKDNVPTSQVNASLSGGSGKTTYYVSGSYFKQEGLTYRSDFDRLTFRSNVTSTINDWLRFGVNMSMGVDNRQTNPYGSNSTNRGLALLAAPFYSPVDTNGVEYPNLIPGWGRYNPKYLADNIRSDGRNLQFNPTGYVEISPIKGLIVKSQLGVDAYDYTSKTVQLPSYLSSPNNGNVAESFDRGVLTTITNTAEYKFDIGQDHKITALAGHEFVKNDTRGISGSSTGQTDNRLLLISAGPNNRNASSYRNEYAFQSFFGRVEYGWRNKYILTGSIRQDQSSKFGIDNRSSNFWSAGARWQAKKESFLQNVNWLTDLAVRFSIGTSGNSSVLGNYDNLATVGTSQYDGQSGFGIGSAGNPNLGWEAKQQVNLGFDINIIKKVNLTIDLYQTDTKNQLFSVPFPYTSGFSSIFDNVGTVRNTGIDVELSYDVYKTRKASITPYITLNYNKNKVTELFQGRNYWVIPNTGVSYVIGQPVSYIYPLWAGVDPATGNAQWYLPNTDPEKFVYENRDPSRVTSTFNSAALQQGTGIQRYAPFTGAFGVNASYSGFYLTAHFTFAQGKYLINNDRYFFENPSQFPGFNQSTTILDYWKQAGDVTTFPKYGVQFTQFDDRLIEEASFMRLKALTIGYQFPKELLAKQNVVKGVNLSVTGRNLWTLTKYSGPDPEVDSNLSLGANPNTTQTAVTLKLDF